MHNRLALALPRFPAPCAPDRPTGGEVLCRPGSARQALHQRPALPCTRGLRAGAWATTVVTVLVLAGCGGLPQPPAAKATFDLGPLADTSARANQAPARNPAAPPPAVRLMTTTAPQALSGTDMRYRLVYAQPLQPHAYTLARWSMPPAQLVHQRLQAALLADGWQLSADASPATPELQVELDAFEQRFDAADRSQGQLQLRVSLRQGPATLAQTRITAQAPAPTPDAAGGAQALAAATQAATEQLRDWLAQHRPTPSGARQP